ncbi:MAG: class I SAM-dependent methyltransferase [Haloarculaceae archaeon]
MARELGNEFDSEAGDSERSFVGAYGRDLVDLLDPAPEERVLDFGCGTGTLTAAIAHRGASVVGVDADGGLVERARENHPDLQFHHVDATDFSLAESADAVLSNSVLHWINDQDGIVDQIAEALRPGGRFVAEMAITGTVGTMLHAVRAEARARGEVVENPWHFPTVAEHAVRLERHGFEVRLTRLFDRPTALDGEDGLRIWLNQFGDGLFASVEDEESREEIITAVEDRLRPESYLESAEEWVADYRRLRFVAVWDGGT